MKKLWKIVSVMLAAFAVVVASAVYSADTQAAAKMTITGCTINPDQATVTVSVSGSSLPASDDGMLYLFAESVFSDTITTIPIASQALANNANFVVELLKDTEQSRLYSKFVVATKQGSQFVPASGFKFITNPQAIANQTGVRVVTTSKKGVIPSPDAVTSGELMTMGVQNVTYNVQIGRLLGPTSNASYPTVNYTYNGKVYQFNGLVVAEYDNIFRNFQAQGISVTGVILNTYNKNYSFMLHPLSRDGTPCAYYMFNAATQTGVEYLAAVGTFLAGRYNGLNGYGQVDNWVIGNEVPARTQWNYIQSMPVDQFAQEYADGLRVFFNAIKSTNNACRVFLCIDQVWDTNKNYPFRYDCRDFLDSVNNYISSQGNLAWGVACHPYPVPLTYAPWWMGGAYYKNLIKHKTSTAYISMENIEVLTDYLSQQVFLTPSNCVRPIICSEVGYTSTQGEQYQAAAFVWGYLQAEKNQHIDAFNYNALVDHPEEVAQGLALGLKKSNGAHKLIYDYFVNIDNPNTSTYYKRTARETIGLKLWSDVLTPR